MTTEEVQKLLQVNLRTVYRLIRNQGLPAHRVGRQWRFHRHEVERWLLPRTRRTRRVLVVDDEESVRELVAKTLTNAMYEVETATDGAAAVARLRDHQYDLLITDLKMPGMDGLSVIREARRSSMDLPIIIITGYSTEASAIEAINLGVCGYLTKPFRLPKIVSEVDRAFGGPPPADQVSL
ncbi:MAG: response regulator [Vicinamibacterales bacterium]